MRAALYARFSTDKQSEASIDDQLRVCRLHAELEGWRVVAEHADRATSGSTPILARPGSRALLEQALAGKFDILIVEGLDRISRDAVESEQIVRRLEHRAIRIIGVSDGYDSQSSSRKVMRGVRGLINEIYLDDLRYKTHRGLAGKVDSGFSAGGLSYGYRSVKSDAGSRLEIDPEQAHWVKWIFEQYAIGRSAQFIAHELNRQGVVSQRGSTWAVSALYGSPAKGSGVLNNELYIGRYIWNRSKWVKDPDTGKRQRTDRPESEWQIDARPALRIIDEELWQAVRERRTRPQREGGGKGAGPGPRTLFGGLMTCGVCGGAIVATSVRHYGCAARKDRGPTVCAGVTLPRQATDQVLLGYVQDEILAPDVLNRVRAEIEALAGSVGSRERQARRQIDARLVEVEREIARLVDAVASVGLSEALRTRLATAEAERVNLLGERDADVPEAPELDVDKLMQDYRAMVADLREALSDDVLRAREILRHMLGRLVANLDDQGPYLDIGAERETPRAVATAGAFPIVVAGAGFGNQKRLRISK